MHYIQLIKRSYSRTKNYPGIMGVTNIDMYQLNLNDTQSSGTIRDFLLSSLWWAIDGPLVVSILIHTPPGSPLSVHI